MSYCYNSCPFGPKHRADVTRIGVNTGVEVDLLFMPQMFSPLLGVLHRLTNYREKRTEGIVSLNI